jgi:hypothetical protein
MTDLILSTGSSLPTSPTQLTKVNGALCGIVVSVSPKAIKPKRADVNLAIIDSPTTPNPNPIRNSAATHSPQRSLSGSSWAASKFFKSHLILRLLVDTRCHCRWATQVILLAFGSHNRPLLSLVAPGSRMHGSMPIIEVRGSEPTGPSRSRQGTSPGPIVQHGTEAPPPAAVIDLSNRRGAPNLQPISSKSMFLPQQNVHAHARVLRAVITRVLHLIESHPPVRYSRDRPYIVHTSSRHSRSRRDGLSL